MDYRIRMDREENRNKEVVGGGCFVYSTVGYSIEVEGSSVLVGSRCRCQYQLSWRGTHSVRYKGRAGALKLRMANIDYVRQTGGLINIASWPSGRAMFQFHRGLLNRWSARQKE